MSSTADRLTQLAKELEALKAIQTQEDYDEGARLHAEKNAPWVNGMYSHLKFPPYVFVAYPAAMYHVDFAAAYRDWMLTGSALYESEKERTNAIEAATRALDKCVKKVENEAEAQQLGALWAPTPQEAEARRLAIARDLEVNAAHLNYEDRNLTGPALAERELADEVSDGHLVDVTETLKKHKGRKAAVGA